MNYTFDNLINSKTEELIAIKDITTEMIKEAEYWRKVGTECAKRSKTLLSKN